MLTAEMGAQDLTRQEREASNGGPSRAGSVGWHVACGIMTFAAFGLVAAVLLGAPLVSILLAGVLLLCPLLMWAPLRYQDRSLRSLRLGKRAR